MPETQEMRVQSLGQEDLLEKEMAMHSSILPGKPHEQSSLEGYSPWDLKESDMTEHTHRHKYTWFIAIVCNTKYQSFKICEYFISKNIKV